MNIHTLEIPDVKLIETQVFGDDRGYFLETWSRQDFLEAGLDHDFVQDNFSSSSRGILRGLHYQIELAQGKLVRCTRGEVFDVAVDLRRSSETFGKWVGATLSEENKHAVWIPPGFAHGFLVMSEIADFQYKCTNTYAPEHDRTIRWDDPDIGIQWPLADGQEPTVSEKDAKGTALKDAEVYS
jgi:dTDP-4-dehydrorhamnose 3,5-epimerase